MSGYDLQGILHGYDERQRDLDAEKDKTTKEALDEAMQANQLAAVRREREERLSSDESSNKEDSDRSLQESREAESGTQNLEISSVEYQKELALKLMNARNAKNVQKLISIRNMQRGVNKEIGSDRGFVKTAGKNQMSTVTVPTQLLRYIQQEIGAISVRITQNDAVAGFLYWYFGRPEDVVFPDESTASKIGSILESLEMNAAPARANKLNYNTMTSLLEKIELMVERMELIQTSVDKVSIYTQDNLRDNKKKLDKVYIALCYNILNMLAFAPPIMPGERPEDIDYLANGTVWDMMSGMDNAYTYFTETDGRQHYKDQMRRKARTFAYAPPVQMSDPVPIIAGNGVGSSMDPGYDNDQDVNNYDDDYDYDPNADSDYEDIVFDDGDDIFDGFGDHGYDIPEAVTVDEKIQEARRIKAMSARRS